MTSHRRPQRHTRAAALGVTTAAVASVALAPGVGNASPTPSLTSAKAQVEKLQQQADADDQQYDQANEQMLTLQKQVDSLQAQIAQEQAALNKVDASLGTLAAAQYRSGGVDQTLELMLSQHPDQFLQQSSAMQRVNSDEASELAEVRDEQRQLQQDKAEATADLAELQHERTILAQKKSDAEDAVRKEQSIVDQLTAAQQAVFQQILTGGETTVKPAGLPVVGGRIGEAIDFAEEQVAEHKAYVLGATGPDAWDCSGLMQASYRQAGVQLGRTTYQQIDDGTPVTPSLSDLKPGDLIFYYAGPDHVAMYVGNGIIVQAANPSAGLNYASWNSMPITGAVRILNS